MEGAPYGTDEYVYVSVRAHAHKKKAVTLTTGE